MKKNLLLINAIFLVLTTVFYSGNAFAEVKTDCDDKNQICIIMDVKKEFVEFSIQNKTFASRTAKLEFITENIKASKKVPEFIIMKDNKKHVLANLTPIDPKKPISLKYNIVTNIVGDFKEKADDYVYALPFEAGKSFKLIQSFNGSFTHNTKDTNFALDFKMPEGTPIYAARDGVVIEVRDSFTKGGKDKSLEDKANRIYVEHSDGSYAVYQHLKNKGALVKEGQRVKRGEKIGLSGFTGYADVPHLHFAILKGGQDMIEKSIQFKFDSKDGLVTKPEQGKSYTAK
jgi:murein DD-endopeptidase MepM/ murein hydrolase activator NlpD